MTTGTNQKQFLQNGYAIREIRRREGITLSELAKEIGISDPHLRNLELEHRSARPELITRIARKLNVPRAAIVRAPAAPKNEIRNSA